MEQSYANQELDQFRIPLQDVALEAQITEMIVRGEFREAANAEHEQAIRVASMDEPELALSFLDIAVYLRNKYIALEGENLTTSDLDEVTKEKIKDVVQAAIVCKRFGWDPQAFIQTAHSLNRSLSMSVERFDIEDMLDDSDPELKQLITVEQRMNIVGDQFLNQVVLHRGTAAIEAQHISGIEFRTRYSAMLLRPAQAICVNVGGKKKIVVNLEGRAQYWADTSNNRQRLEADSVTFIGDLS